MLNYRVFACQNAANTESGPAMPTPAWLPSRTALLVAAIAFAAGLLLFVALWLDQRSSNDFYKSDGLPLGVEGRAFDPLPAPLPASKAGHVGNDGHADDEEDAGEPRPGAQLPEVEPAPLPPMAPPPPAPAPPPITESSIPRPVDAPPPRYPNDALRRGQQGTVLLRVHVDAGGNPGDIDIVAGSGSRSLDRAAVEAVRHWRFAPAMQGGQPVAGTVQVPIDFTLQR
jgi:protein TonB